MFNLVMLIHKPMAIAGYINWLSLAFSLASLTIIWLDVHIHCMTQNGELHWFSQHRGFTSIFFLIFYFLLLWVRNSCIHLRGTRDVLIQAYNVVMIKSGWLGYPSTQALMIIFFILIQRMPPVSASARCDCLLTFSIWFKEHINLDLICITTMRHVSHDAWLSPTYTQCFCFCDSPKSFL